MPTNKNFNKRRNKINEYLRNGMHPLTLDEIKEKLIVDLNLTSLSKRTVQADIDFLKDLDDAPIVNIKRGNRTVLKYEDPNFSIHKIPIDPKELQSLQKIETLATCFTLLKSNGIHIKNSRSNSAPYQQTVVA